LSEATSNPSDAEPGKPCQRKSVFDWSEEDRRKTTSRWWDIFAQYTVLLDSRGWQQTQIAEFFNQPIAEVEAILLPMPPSRFEFEADGRGVFEPKEAQPIIERHYHNTVQAVIAGILSTVYGSACYGAECEGWPDTKTEMEAMQRRWSSRCKRLDEDGEQIFDLEWEHDSGVALFCCALTDARIALGIERPHKSLLFMLAEFTEILEDQRAKSLLE
jgi:hypothetical protein